MSQFAIVEIFLQNTVKSLVFKYEAEKHVKTSGTFCRAWDTKSQVIPQDGVSYVYMHEIKTFIWAGVTYNRSSYWTIADMYKEEKLLIQWRKWT